jgi:germination protein M
MKTRETKAPVKRSPKAQAGHRRLVAFAAVMLACMLVVALVASVGGCAQKARTPAPPSGKPAEKPGETTQPSPPSTEKPETMQVIVYYVKMKGNDMWMVKEAHEVTKTTNVARAALQELISGQPQTEGAYRVLPAGTTIRGITIKDGLCTVDFSREVLNAAVGAQGEAYGIKTIVNTLTEFPTIKKVQFLVEGKLDERARDWWGHVGLYDQPFERDLTYVLEPAIWVTEPKFGARITSPVRVRGDAAVFEATVNIRLVTADGTKLAETVTTASEGAPGRGDFDARVSFTPPPSGTKGYLEVFWVSPKDGSEKDTVRIPVEF